MKQFNLLLVLFCVFCTFFNHAHGKDADLGKEDVEALIEVLRGKKSPDIYGTIYYPSWKKPMDGLKSVTVEAIAENASDQIHSRKVILDVISEPVVIGSMAGVFMKRSGGGHEEGRFPVYLYRDPKNGWGFLGLPLPYKTPVIPGFPRDDDDKFMESALNSMSPYQGPLYEFEKKDQKVFSRIAEKLAAMKQQAVQGSGVNR